MAKPAPLTRFETLVQDRVRRDTDFASALLVEALQSLLDGDTDTARSHIRDLIKGSLGYGELSTRTGIPAKSLIRMFGPSGNPTLENVATVLQVLQQCTGVALKVSGIPAASGARKQAARQSRAAYVVESGVPARTKARASSSRRKLSPSSSRRKPSLSSSRRKPLAPSSRRKPLAPSSRRKPGSTGGGKTKRQS